MNEILSWVLGGIGSLLGITNTGLGFWSADQDRNYNSAEAAKNRDFQREERLATQQFALDMWNANNDYNSLGSQLERARDVGVNPAAIVGGDYKPAQSSSPTSTPMSGSQASSNAGSALASSLVGSSPMQPFNDAYSSFVDAETKKDTAKINREQLTESIRVNDGLLKEYASKAGLHDASTEQIKKSLQWADELNYTAVAEKRANILKLYNDNYIAFERLNLDSAATAADIASTVAETEYQTIVNKYADRTLLAQASIEEVRAFEYGLRKEIAQVLGVPLGSSEFEFNYALIRNGQWFEYLDTAIRGETDARLKPNERYVPYRKSSKFKRAVSVAGRPLGAYEHEFVDEGLYHYSPQLYPPSQTILNPIYSPRIPLRY